MKTSFQMANATFELEDKVQYIEPAVRDIYHLSADDERRQFGYDIIEIDEKRRQVKVIVNEELNRFAWWSFDAIEYVD